MRRILCATLLLVVGAAPVSAQRPASTKPSQPPSVAAPTPEVPLPVQPVDNFTYSTEGRRDPFVSLLHMGTEGRAPGRRLEGLQGFGTNEISVRGILQSRGSLVAMLQCPDNKTYIVHSGDKLADGTIRSITPTGIVVMQEVNDPLSLVKQREVTRLLRTLEGAK